MNGGIYMAFDGIMLSSVIYELNHEIITGRVDRIYQPEKDEIHIYVRANRENHLLLLTSNPSYPRIHLTEDTKSNPDRPPVFCMVLRKHLIGARLIAIEQPGFDRICHIKFETMDELGDITTKTLAIEIMGRHSNIILFDHNDIIIDSIKRVPESISRIRQILPGREYCLPPGGKKQSPLIEKGDRLKKLLQGVEPDQFAKTIFRNYLGISPVSADEIVYRAFNNKYKDNVSIKGISLVCDAFLNLFNDVKNGLFVPTILYDEERMPKDILPFEYMQFPIKLQAKYESASKAISTFYADRDKINRLKQRSSDLDRLLKRELEHNQKKLAVQEQELTEAKRAKKYQLWGELITANIYQISKGKSEVSLPNYYKSEGDLEHIPLDPNKTAAQNAEKYFRQYRKLQNASRILSRRIVSTRNEIDYIENQIENLSKCTEEAEIDEIREELIQEGYIRRRGQKRHKKRRVIHSKPLHFISSDGYDMYVGKNNKQNDYLTLQKANNNDLWLHVKDIPGSHVIIRSQGKPIPITTLNEGAMLAAYYSKGRQSSNVEVDYCLRRHVRKPSGAKPGMVIYDNHSTVYITPEESIINGLKTV